MKRYCIVNNDLPFPSQLAGLCRLPFAAKGADLAGSLASFLGARHCYLTSSGFAALHLALSVLRELHPERNEVVLPAYTAPGLVLPVRALGLTVRLCDVSLSSFSIDPENLAKAVGPKTLAVVAASMFGIPCHLAKLAAVLPRGAVLIDDVAQSLGSASETVPEGQCPVAIGSFDRGKNFSLCHGGFLSITDDRLNTLVRERYLQLPRASLQSALGSTAKHLLFSLMVEPHLYQLTAPAARRMRRTAEQKTYSLCRLHPLSAAAGDMLLRPWLNAFAVRQRNGELYQRNLSGVEGIHLPEIKEGMRPAFNRFPVLIEDTDKREELISALSARGIEGSVMYGRPVHEAWETGYRRGDLPQAEYLAAHLLTLPAYGLLDEGTVESTCRTVRSVLKGGE